LVSQLEERGLLVLGCTKKLPICEDSGCGQYKLAGHGRHIPKGLSGLGVVVDMSLDAINQTLECAEVAPTEAALKVLRGVTKAKGVELPLWTACFLNPPVGTQYIPQIHAKNRSILRLVLEACVRKVIVDGALGRSDGRHLLYVMLFGVLGVCGGLYGWDKW
jgi:hypothetical protein